VLVAIWLIWSRHVRRFAWRDLAAPWLDCRCDRLGLRASPAFPSRARAGARRSPGAGCRRFGRCSPPASGNAWPYGRTRSISWPVQSVGMQGKRAARWDKSASRRAKHAKRAIYSRAHVFVRGPPRSRSAQTVPSPQPGTSLRSKYTASPRSRARRTSSSAPLEAPGRRRTASQWCSNRSATG
jgi:hypothetical protein